MFNKYSNVYRLTDQKGDEIMAGWPDRVSRADNNWPIGDGPWRIRCEILYHIKFIVVNEQ